MKDERDVKDVKETRCSDAVPVSFVGKPTNK